MFYDSREIEIEKKLVNSYRTNRLSLDEHWQTKFYWINLRFIKLRNCDEFIFEIYSNGVRKFIIQLYSVGTRGISNYDVDDLIM